MKLAIIGTGNMANGLGRKLATAGHSVRIAGRNIEKSQALADRIGHSAAAGAIAEAVSAAEVVILAVPYAAVGEVIAAAGGVAGKIVIDITNPITADYMALTIGHTTSAGEEIQKLLPGSRVVKAFNTIFASVLELPNSDITGWQVFTASDDIAAAQTVGGLIRDIGFVPVHAGPLANSRYLEPVGELNIHLGYALGYGTAIAPAWNGLK